jgi:polar amino acid transport system substrate-binding protein
VKITDVGVSAVIPVAVGQLVNSADRRKVVNFVDYIANDLGLIVREADADKISPNDLCGHTLVATQGTGPLAFGKEYSKKECVGKGRPPITFDTYTDSAGTFLALANGRGDGFLSNAAVGTYLAANAKQGLAMDEGLVPGSTDRSGIVFAKGDDALGQAIRAALVSLHEDGLYQKILEKWDIGNQALSEAELHEPAA